MEQKNQAEKKRDRRYCAQQEQRGQGTFETKAANGAAQSSDIPGMPRILQVRTASADHTVGECILDSGFVIVCMKQLRCQLPTAQRAQLRLFLCRCSTWFVWLHVRDKAALGAFTPMPGFITS